MLEKKSQADETNRLVAVICDQLYSNHYSLTYLLTYLPTYLLTYLPTYLLTHSLTYLLTHSLTYLLTSGPPTVVVLS